MESVKTIELSVVMPVYNEEKVLAEAIEEALIAMKGADFSYEILLCNDASTDGSGAILAQYADKYPNQVRVVTHAVNRGIMGALATLFESARGRFIFFNSSDGQFKTSDALRMMQLRDKYDIVVGKRERKLYNWRRHLVSWAFNRVPKWFFGVETYDAGSIKLYTAEVLTIPLVSLSPFREAERLIRAQKMGKRIGMVSVDHCQRRGGRATGAQLRLLVHSLCDVLRLRFCSQKFTSEFSSKPCSTHKT